MIRFSGELIDRAVSDVTISAPKMRTWRQLHIRWMAESGYEDVRIYWKCLPVGLSGILREYPEYNSGLVAVLIRECLETREIAH